jgi:hypothetical protein
MGLEPNRGDKQSNRPRHLPNPFPDILPEACSPVSYHAERENDAFHGGITILLVHVIVAAACKVFYHSRLFSPDISERGRNIVMHC